MGWSCVCLEMSKNLYISKRMWLILIYECGWRPKVCKSSKLLLFSRDLLNHAHFLAIKTKQFDPKPLEMTHFNNEGQHSLYRGCVGSIVTHWPTNSWSIDTGMGWWIWTTKTFHLWNHLSFWNSCLPGKTIANVENKTFWRTIQKKLLHSVFN